MRNPDEFFIRDPAAPQPRRHLKASTSSCLVNPCHLYQKLIHLPSTCTFVLNNELVVCNLDAGGLGPSVSVLNIFCLMHKVSSERFSTCCVGVGAHWPFSSTSNSSTCPNHHGPVLSTSRRVRSTPSSPWMLSPHLHDKAQPRE